MNLQHPVRYFIALFLISIVSAGCTRHSPTEDRPGIYYEKAASLVLERDDNAALEALSHGIALDSLDGFSPATAAALDMKRQIEERNGDFFDALDTHRLIESRCSGMLEQEKDRERLRQKAIIYSLLGDVDEAVRLMRDEQGVMKRGDLLLMARWYEMAGRFDRSAEVYQDLARSDDLLLRIEGLAGLLELSQYRTFNGQRPTAYYAVRIIATAKQLLDTPGPPLFHARAIRRAAMSLAETGRYDEDASYLFFKALSYARASGDERLQQLLDFESNNVRADNPDVYGRTTAYFEEHRMELPHALALIGRAGSGRVDVAERMRLLQQGVRLLQYQLPCSSFSAAGRRFRAASGRLVSLQISRGLFDDAFMIDEAMRTRELQALVLDDPSLFSLPDVHEALEREILRLGREIEALLQRSVVAYESGSGLELLEHAGRAVSARRGRLDELLAGIRGPAPVEADKIQPEPVTIATLQKSLLPGSIILKIVVSDEWLAAYCIGKERIDVARKKIDASDVDALTALLRGHIELAQDNDLSPVARHSSRLSLTEMVLAPFAGQLRNVGHLTCISDEMVPVHLLGENRYLARDIPVSQLGSAREYVWYCNAQDSSGSVAQEIDFVDASSPAEAARIKLRHPDRALFLLWKSAQDKDRYDARVLLSLAMQQGSGPAAALLQMVRTEGRSDGPGWLTLTSYGVR